MERHEYRDPSLTYERTEGKVRFAARRLLKLKGSLREAAINLYIPEQYQAWVRRTIQRMET